MAETKEWLEMLRQYLSDDSKKIQTLVVNTNTGAISVRITGISDTLDLAAPRPVVRRGLERALEGWKPYPGEPEAIAIIVEKLQRQSQSFMLSVVCGPVNDPHFHYHAQIGHRSPWHTQIDFECDNGNGALHVLGDVISYCAGDAGFSRVKSHFLRYISPEGHERIRQLSQAVVLAC